MATCREVAFRLYESSLGGELDTQSGFENPEYCLSLASVLGNENISEMQNVNWMLLKLTFSSLFFFLALAFVFLKYESITLQWWNLETESGFVICSDEHNYCINGVSHCFVSFFFL